MDRSLSVILPVRNGERQLAERVHGVVDCVAELSKDLEILIIDDGSTDNTEEVAMELAQRFPQVCVIRRSHPHGATEAINVGVRRSSGEIILVHNIEIPPSDAALRHLWAMRDDVELVAARSEVGRTSDGSDESWMDFDTKLLRRQAVDEFQDHEPGVLINRVTRTDLGAGSPVAPPAPVHVVSSERAQV